MAQQAWIPVSEQMPKVRQVVVVCQPHEHGATVTAGWLATEKTWWLARPRFGNVFDIEDVRPTDCWTVLPQWEPANKEAT